MEKQAEYIQNMESRSIFCGDLHIKPGYPVKLEKTTLAELSETYPAVKQKVAGGFIRKISKQEADAEVVRIDAERQARYSNLKEA